MTANRGSTTAWSSCTLARLGGTGKVRAAANRSPRRSRSGTLPVLYRPETPPLHNVLIVKRDLSLDSADAFLLCGAQTAVARRP